ncbi:hypothetical protein AVEN_15622-1 [Araneus ventricosus]|uniref:Uncharacterized protein n=1 Tax=Araneus ventricosus TaxID=182803 RepID=A0A4Y2U4I6_ARAVE|nr:hypothetical protein AVEN_15622-1 [Araneus ventricosus]
MPETGPLTRSMDEKFEKLFAMMAEMKAGLEDKMEAGQEEMRSGKEEIKSQIQAHTENQVEEMKIHVDGCIGKIEEEVQCVKLKIEKVESEVQRKIEESNCEVQEKVGNLERRISELEERPNDFPASPEFTSSRRTVKPLTFDRQTSWTVFKTQFDVVTSTNEWTDFAKPSQLVASLRGSAAEVLQGI